MPRQTKMQKMKGLWNASLVLGCVLLVGLGIYGLGKLNPVTSAPNDTSKLRVQGIDNIVQYLKEMEIYDPANPNDPTKKVVIGWDESLKGVVIKGDVNMESIVVRTSGDANTSPSSNEAQSSTVIGGTANRVFVDTDATTNKNLAIIAGNANRIENAGNAFIAGGNAVEVKNASNAAVVAASGSRIAGDQPKGEVAIIAGEGNAINGERINNAVIFAGKNSVTSASNTVLIGNNIKAGDKQKIFVWSDADGEFAPGHSSAFYVNATKGSLGVNTNHPRVRADINGPLGIKTYQPNSLPTVTPDWKGGMLTAKKGDKSGLCGWDGSKWVPLSLVAKNFGLCVEDVNMPTLPANATSNGKTKLPPLWNPAGNGAWETPQWTYNQRLGDGEYRCNVGYHIGNADPDGKVVAKDCVACTDIPDKQDWTSDGKNDDCAFNCKASFKHNASARTCTACANGTYTTAGNTDSTCKSCTGLPTNAHWTSNGTSETSCSWACNSGYNKRGNECKKATWTKVESASICRTSPGRWKDAYKSITYVCRDADGDVQDGNICNHRGTKPADITVNVEGDDNCNPPRLTEWSCNPPVCTGAGQCGGAKQNVNCTRRYQDPAGNTYSTSEILTKTEERSCDTPCQQASCGTAHNVNHASLSATSAGLCTIGKVDAFAEHSTNYTNKWTWKCLAKDGNTDCYAHKPRPEAGQCSSEIGKCLKGSSVMGSLANGSRWTCKGNHGGADVICNACNDGFRYDGAANSCVSQCEADYEYVPGATLHNGYCAKWKCETQKAQCVAGGQQGVCTGQTGLLHECDVQENYNDCLNVSGTDKKGNPIVCVWTPCGNFQNKVECNNNTRRRRACKWSESTTSSPKCVRQDGQPATDANCSSIGNKPTCNPTSGGGASGGNSTPLSSFPTVRIRVKCVSHAIVGMQLADMPFGRTSMTLQEGSDYTIRTNAPDIYHLDLPILNKGQPMPANERPFIYKGDSIRANTSGPLENIIVYKERNSFSEEALIPDDLKLPEYTIPADIQDGAIFELDIIECTPPTPEEDDDCTPGYHSCIGQCSNVNEKECKDNCRRTYCINRGL